MKLNSISRNDFSDDNLIGLDLFRFLLSLTILIVHFPHFSQSFSSNNSFDENQLPYFSILSKLYKNGGFAVQLFWMLSGVIFSQFYFKKIENLSFSQYIYLRITRLYPIHIITLILVFILQKLFHNNFGFYFIINNNDFFHFILNIFLINYWNSDFNLSFNAPFWSVSIEIFSYILFFIFVSNGAIKKVKNLFIFVLVFLLFSLLKILSPFNECLLYFFTGVLIVRIYKQITYKILISLIIILFSLFLFKNTNIYLKYNFKHLVITIQGLVFSIIMIYLFSIKISLMNRNLKLVLRELSNLTYSMYMIHFSVQMILILLYRNYGLSFFNNKIFFLNYIILNIFLSYLVYNFFELPFQNFLRKKFIK